MEIGHSVYKNCEEIFWCPMDTMELFNSHLEVPEKRALLEKYRWIDAKFTYRFNKEGFRCDEFTNISSIVFLGCSMTMGIGLPVEFTWPYLVSNNLNLSCYNLGIAGSSNDTAFRMAYAWLEKINPTMVIFCQTFSHRWEIFAGNGFTGRSIHLDNGKFENEWVGNPINGILNKEKNRLAVQQLCNNLGIKFISTEVEKIEFLDLARDLYHPGVESNKKFADYVLSLI